MRRNGYLWTSGVNLDTAVRFADPDFLLGCKNFGDSALFYVNFCILYSECPPYFYFRFVGPTDLESKPRASTPTLIIPTKFEVDMTIHCRVIACLPTDTSRDFVTLTFDLLTLNSCCAWWVTLPTLLPSLKTLRLSVLDLSHNVSRWLPLKMRTRPLLMRRVTWPCVGGQKQLHFWYATSVALRWK